MDCPEDFLRAIPPLATAERVEVLQDGNCVCCSVEVGGRSLFVKWAAAPASVSSLRQAIAINAAVRHPALPAVLNVIETPTSPVLVYEWLTGESLRKPGGERFRALPIGDQQAAVDTLLDVHVRVAEAGYIAVDLYDGSLMYDFDAGRLRVFDLDEYRDGPFTLDAERLPGSTRFMAPEEFVRGSLIDQTTNVFTLGRAMMVLLGDVQGQAAAWRGPAKGLAVAVKASSPARAERFATVRELVNAWRAATA